MRLAKILLPALLGILGIVIAARSLAETLQSWSLILLLLSSLLLLISLVRPMFTNRVRGGKKRSGLPSKYERERDPWRSLSAGRDPTEQ
jgi:hypothetical protein